MAFTYDFTDNGNSVTVKYNGLQDTFGKNSSRMVIPNDTDDDTLILATYAGNAAKTTIRFPDDTITGIGAGSTTATELRDALQAIFFLELVWGEITGDINNQLDLPFTVSGTGLKDAFFKGDITAFGEILAQGNSLILANTIALGGSNELPFMENLLNGQQSYFGLNPITNGESEGLTYVDAYDPYTKDDPFGMQQPNDPETFTTTPFVDKITGETKYHATVIISSQFSGITYTWYLRSLTGFVNGYLKGYIGAVTDPNQDGENWKSNTDKDIINKENLITNTGGAGIDIEFPLGKSYFQKQGDDLTFFLICDNDFTYQGITVPLPPPYSNEIPYIVVDGTLWRPRLVPPADTSDVYDSSTIISDHTLTITGLGTTIDYTEIEFIEVNSTTDPIIPTKERRNIEGDTFIPILSSDVTRYVYLDMDTDILEDFSSVLPPESLGNRLAVFQYIVSGSLVTETIRGVQLEGM